jgi:hypothetical protein
MEQHEDIPFDLPKSIDANFEFYDIFYDTAPQDIENEAAIMQLCMIAVSPAVGPESGGTAVTLQLAGQIHPGHELFYCAFGSTIVQAVNHYTLPGSESIAIVCMAPPQTSADGREVMVKLSLDGALFSVTGAIFYYHAPLELASVSPESPATGLAGGLQVYLQLDHAAGGLFGPEFDPEVTSVPASCAFGDT